MVVSDGVTGWRIFDAKVRLSSVTQITNEEGAAFFSLDDHRQKFHLQVWKEHYDTVSLSKYAHTPTDVIQIKLYPQVGFYYAANNIACQGVISEIGPRPRPPGPFGSSRSRRRY